MSDAITANDIVDGVQVSRWEYWSGLAAWFGQCHLLLDSPPLSVNLKSWGKVRDVPCSHFTVEFTLNDNFFDKI
jgi:hypothetical protein